MKSFDQRALLWDNDPTRRERAEKVAGVIKRVIPLSKEMTALEYGCGTGLLSFTLFPYLKSINMMDSSQGMLNVLQEKINKNQINNMVIQKHDLIEDPCSKEKYDLIYTLMTLHHIEDLEGILGSFNKLLNVNGYLCIADLDQEDGSFHGKGFIGHHGFNREEFIKTLGNKGFGHVHSELCYTFYKKDINGKVKEYPLFTMIAEKIS